MPRWIAVTTIILSATTAHAEPEKIAALAAEIDPSAEGQVPGLIDDYILTAIQGLGGKEVVGRDDINALIGFEKQKELLGCDDVSCFAAIGGALGVEKLVAVKVARTGHEWAVTAKVINIREAKVENRVAEFIPGDTASLLKGIATVMGKLFNAPAAAVAAPGPKPTATAAAPRLPAEATGFEIRLGMILHFGTVDEVDNPESYADGDHLISQGIVLVPHVAWRYRSFGRLSLFAVASGGITFPRSVNVEDNGAGGRSTITGDITAGWFEILQVVRYALMENNERWLLMPSDRVSIEAALGAHLIVGAVGEVGLSARLELHAAWLVLGGGFTLGGTTGFQPLLTTGLRLGF